MISSEHLLLRNFDVDDWRGVHEWCSDPEVMRYMLAGDPWTEEQSRAYVDHAMTAAEADPRTEYSLAIALRSTGEVIGGCRLSLGPFGPQEAGIGFGLTRRRWGQGLGTEAVQLLLEFGFGELRLHRIHADTLAVNEAAIRVLEKSGMRQEGCFRQRLQVEGEWLDTLAFAILKREWEQN